MKISPSLKNGVITGCAFFFTVTILSVGYATFSSHLSSSDRVGAGSGLTANAWNKIVDSIVELDGRTFGLTSNWGNIGIGTGSSSARLEVNGDMKISGGVLGAGFGKLFTSAMPKDMSFWANSSVVGGSTNPMPVGTYFYQIYGCHGQNDFPSWAIGSFVFVSWGGNWTDMHYFNNTNIGGGSCGYFRSGFIQVSVPNSIMQFKISGYQWGSCTDPYPTTPSISADIWKIF